MLNQVMTATRGATDAFSGVGRHVNNSLRKVGAKGIEAGIGCGVGFGHGFGVGLAVKRGVVERIQLYLIQSMTKLMMKSGMSTGLSIGQGILPQSLQAGMKTVNEASNQNPLGIANPVGSILPASLQTGMKTVIEASNQYPLGMPNPLEEKVPHSSSLGFLTARNTNSLSSHENETSRANVSSSNASYSIQTENGISNFLQSPLVKEEDGTANELSERLRSENNLLHIVLKHQQVIDELMQENEKLRQILVKDLKVSPSKLQTSYSSGSKFTSTECFECRRKQRRRR
ncbi:unnamed protein product [Withania somnifera]